ncbi:MAG: hypothetical protein QM611_06360, partial [Microbacterium sp.]
ARREGAPPIAADVRGAGAAGAVLAAVWSWADAGPGRTALASTLDEALDAAFGPDRGSDRP